MELISKSIEIIKENQSETGAYIASPNLPIYKYSWFRDGSWIAHAMLIAGEKESAEKFHDWASNVINNNKEKILNAIKKAKKGVEIGEDFIHARYTVYGKEVSMKWGEFQLDGLGVWLWALSLYVKETGMTKEKWLEAASLVCEYLRALWKMPCNDLWEENSGKIHTSTLASIYGGLNSFSTYFPERKLKETCDEIKKFIMNYQIYKGRLVKYTNDNEVDSSLIMCAIPFNVFNSNDLVMKKTISKIKSDLLLTKGLRRYKHDSFYGGGEWLILACLLGSYYLDINEIEKSKEVIEWIEKQADKKCYLPEQINPVNKEKYYEWVMKWGKPSNPLLWSHAMYIILKEKLQNR